LATPKDIKLDQFLKIKLGSDVDLRFKLTNNTLLEFETCSLKAWSDQTNHNICIYSIEPSQDYTTKELALKARFECSCSLLDHSEIKMGVSFHNKGEIVL
jgi:hypothetical protein